MLRIRRHDTRGNADMSGASVNGSGLLTLAPSVYGSGLLIRAPSVKGSVLRRARHR